MRIRLEDEFGAVVQSLPFNVTIEVLNRAALTDTACLRFLDPFGHTVFNHRQARVLLSELGHFSLELADQVMVDVEGLIQRCVKGTHLYLRFVGS